MMLFYDELQELFSTQSFDEMMSITGQTFRAVETRKTIRFEWQGRGYFIKQHRGVGWKEIIKNLIQGRLPIVSAKNEWKALQQLSLLSIPAPTVVGYGNRGFNPASRESFLITRELPKHASLEDYCLSWPKHPPAFTLKQNIISEVARIARTLHENGINHRDFYLCHFLLDLTMDIQQTIVLYLIDLHRAEIRKKIPVRWQIKDLAGLAFSSQEIGLTKRDRLRFIKQYRNKPLRDIIKKEADFWLKVKQRGDKLYSKHEK